MTVDELRTQLSGLPGTALVAIEYEAGTCLDDDVIGRLDADGTFVLSPSGD